MICEAKTSRLHERRQPRDSRAEYTPEMATRMEITLRMVALQPRASGFVRRLCGAIGDGPQGAFFRQPTDLLRERLGRRRT
jgi:hypothetical protein